MIISVSLVLKQDLTSSSQTLMFFHLFLCPIRLKHPSAEPPSEEVWGEIGLWLLLLLWKGSLWICRRRKGSGLWQWLAGPFQMTKSSTWNGASSGGRVGIAVLDWTVISGPDSYSLCCQALADHFGKICQPQSAGFSFFFFFFFFSPT